MNLDFTNILINTFWSNEVWTLQIFTIFPQLSVPGFWPLCIIFRDDPCYSLGMIDIVKLNSNHAQWSGMSETCVCVCVCVCVWSETIWALNHACRIKMYLSIKHKIQGIFCSGKGSCHRHILLDKLIEIKCSLSHKCSGKCFLNAYNIQKFQSDFFVNSLFLILLSCESTQFLNAPLILCSKCPTLFL